MITIQRTLKNAKANDDCQDIKIMGSANIEAMEAITNDRINFIIVNYNKCVLRERESENERRNMRRM